VYEEWPVRAPAQYFWCAVSGKLMSIYRGHRAAVSGGEMVSAREIAINERVKVVRSE